MSSENPQNIIRSWNTQANFANGRVLMDRLVPPAFSRIRSTFVTTWREDSATVANLDWGSTNFSIYLPESLRVVRAIFLKIECPLSTANFKAIPDSKSSKLSEYSPPDRKYTQRIVSVFWCITVSPFPRSN